MGKKVKKLKAKARIVTDEDQAGNKSSNITGTSSKAQTSNGKSHKSAGGKYTAEQLLTKAEECVDSFDLVLAEKFCKRAVETEPENIRALELMGFLQMQLGDLDSAKTMFNKAISLQPDAGYGKYMQLGQISTGTEAIACYTKGIEIMKQMLATSSSTYTQDAAACAEEKPESEVTARDISSAYCSIAELYLTDLCFEEDADVKCHQTVSLALETDSSNPEAYQILASYWLCKEDKKAAGEALDKGLSLWLPQLREAHKSAEDQNEPTASTSQQTPDPVLICPVSYSVRISYSKTAIELENYVAAQEILQFLLLEDSQVVEVWYLLGWLNYLKGEESYSDARYHLTKGRDLAVKTQCDDEQIIDHMNELLTEIGPATGSDLEDDDGDNDDDIMSDSDSENNPQKEENMEH